MVRLIKLGNRCINIDAITHATFDPEATNPAVGSTWAECCISIGQDCQVFYGDEALTLWGILSDAAIDITSVVGRESAERLWRKG